MDVFGKYTEVLIRWLDCIDAGQPPKIFGEGTQTMDFVFSEDIALANLAAMTSDVTDEIFNVGSGKETSLLNLLRLLLTVTNRPDLKPEFMPERSVNPVPRRWADISKAEQLLGFRAQVPLDEGLRRLVEWRREIIATGRFHDYTRDHQVQ
jgi:UDP-glucose 4-epimerase